MGTLLGTVFGYLVRGTTGREGFEQTSGPAREVGSPREFQSLVQAAKSQAGSMIKDASATPARHADQVADALTGEATASAGPPDWEERPPPRPSRERRPVSEDVKWPDA